MKLAVDFTSAFTGLGCLCICIIHRAQGWELGVIGFAKASITDEVEQANQAGQKYQNYQS
jgi:hypothetical protein